MRRLELIIAGFGNVGMGLAKILHSKKIFLKQKFGAEFVVNAIIDSHGGVINEGGIDLTEAVRTKESSGRIECYTKYGQPGLTVKDALDMVNCDVLVEVTPTNVINGEPGKTHMLQAFDHGIDVVTSNKGPLALFFKEMITSAKRNNCLLLYEATVMSGTPLICFLKDGLKASEVLQIYGILNGTTNFILSEMERGQRSFDDALNEAKKMGIAEADPSLDLNGTDTACKLVIAANTAMGLNLRLKDVTIRGITDVDMEDILNALKKGKTIRLLGIVEKDGEASVGPQTVPINSFLCIYGTLNAVQINTRELGSVFVSGKGAGDIETAFGILNDLLTIDRRCRV